MKASKQSREGTRNAKHVGIWIRVSTEDQVRGESPETHEKRARLYSEAKGWHVVEVYRLDAVSGALVEAVRKASANPDSEIAKSLKRITILVGKYKDEQINRTQDAA